MKNYILNLNQRMLISLIFSFFLFPLFFAFNTSTSLPYCNYLSQSYDTSQSLSNCSIYLGSHTLNSKSNLICYSSSTQSIIIIDLISKIITKTLKPKLIGDFTSEDKCVQLLGTYKNHIACSRQNQLIIFDVLNNLEVYSYTETIFKQLPLITPLSENLDNLIAFEDGYIIKVIDFIKGLEMKIYGGNKYKIKVIVSNSIYMGILFNLEEKKSIEIWDLSDFSLKNMLNKEMEDAFSVIVEQMQILIGYHRNFLIKWNYFNDHLDEINFDNSNIIKVVPFNSNKFGSLLLISTEKSIFFYNLETLLIEKTNIIAGSDLEMVQNSFNSDKNLILLKGDNYFFVDVLTKTILKTLSAKNSSIKIFAWNADNFITLSTFDKKIVYLQSWNLGDCSSVFILRTNDFNYIQKVNYKNETFFLMITNDLGLILYEPFTQNIKRTYNIKQNITFYSLLNLGCIYDNYTILYGYDNSDETYRLFVFNLIEGEIESYTTKLFLKITNLIYLNFRDYIAFESNLTIYIYSIMSQTLINSLPTPNGIESKQIIPLKTVPYVIAILQYAEISLYNIFNGKNINNIIDVQNSDEIKLIYCVHISGIKESDMIIAVHKDKTTKREIIKAWNASDSSLMIDYSKIFQEIDSNINYLQFYYYKRNNANLLVVSSTFKTEIWFLDNNTISQTIMLSKTQNNLLNFAAGEIIISDLSSNTLALWSIETNQQINTVQSNLPQYLCYQNFYYDRKSNDCLKCDNLCLFTNGCFGSRYDQCLEPRCNYMFEKSGNKGCYDCSNDFYFTMNKKKCSKFSNIFTKFNYETYCFSCIDGYYLSTSGLEGECLTCPSNCLTCSGSEPTKCLVCNSTFILFNNKCYNIPYEDSQAPLIIVLAIFVTISAIITIFCCCRELYRDKLLCYICNCTWELFSDYKFQKYKYDEQGVANNNSSRIQQHDVSQEQGLLMSSKDPENAIPFSSRIKIHENIIVGSDHYINFINYTVRMKAVLLDNKGFGNSNKLKMTADFVRAVKNNMPFFFYEIIESDEAFDSKNYFQVKIIKKICDSISGPVFSGEKMCKDRFALKIFIDNLEQLTVEKLEDFIFYLKEQDKIKFNSLPKIMHLHSIVFSQTKTNFCLGVMEELMDYNYSDFYERFGNVLAFRQKIDILLQILDAVKSLHDLGLFHKNIKPSNLLINCEDVNYSINCKIDDFSKHLKLNSEFSLIKQSIGALFQMAYFPPEAFLDKKSGGNKAWDIWMLGVFIYEMIFPENDKALIIPWIRLIEDFDDDERRKDVVLELENELKEEKIKDNEYCLGSKKVDDEITIIINECLQVDEKKRCDINYLIWKVQNYRKKINLQINNTDK